MEWISVKDRLPGFNREVLVYNPNDGVHGSHIYVDSLCNSPIAGKGFWDWNAYDVTHWMPLPEPPNQ